MPFTVTFDPNTLSVQARIIPNATPFQDGVMTKEQAAQLAALVPIIPVVGAVQTVDATPTPIGPLIPVPLDTTVLFTVRATGMRDDSSQGGAYILNGAFRNQAGVVSLIAFTVDQFFAEDNPAWGGPDLAVVGTNVQPNVTGVAATIINWDVAIEVL